MQIPTNKHKHKHKHNKRRRKRNRKRNDGSNTQETIQTPNDGPKPNPPLQLQDQPPIRILPRVQGEIRPARLEQGRSGGDEGSVSVHCRVS